MSQLIDSAVEKILQVPLDVWRTPENKKEAVRLLVKGLIADALNLERNIQTTSLSREDMKLRIEKDLAGPYGLTFNENANKYH